MSSQTYGGFYPIAGAPVFSWRGIPGDPLSHYGRFYSRLGHHPDRPPGWVTKRGRAQFPGSYGLAQ